MAGETHDRDQDATYRLEVEGSVGERWKEWFRADTIRRSGANSVLEVRVADQSELFGRLRRIHDLNIRLVSLTRIDTRSGPGRGEAP